jgi:hypothetical protein
MNTCSTCKHYDAPDNNCLSKETPFYSMNGVYIEPNFGCILWEPAADNRRASAATHDIFIRTCAKDLNWLSYCLRSIAKFARGFRQTIIVAPGSAKAGLDRMNLTQEKVHYIGEYKDDYLGQQISKLLADEWSDADYIWFMDSDCMFNRPTTPDAMFVTGKPVYYYTPEAAIAVDNKWIEIVSCFLGWRPQHEFMRRHPHVFPRDLLLEVRSHAICLHKMPIDDWILHNGKFSEFNAFGAWAYNFKKERFYWWNTLELEQPPAFVTQRWSWSGLLPSERAEMEKALA